MHSPSNGIRILGIVCLVLAVAVPLTSQTPTGRILGTVSDQSGATVAGAAVVVTDVQRGTTRAVASDASGDYVVTELQPGIYKVRAEAKGFKTVERVNIGVEVAQDLRVDISLPTGQVTETVVVTDEVPLVNTTSSTLGGTLSNAEINDLPLNGRNYQNLLNLRPGVVVQPGGGPWTQSANNVRPDESAWMIDGVINSSFFDARPIVNFPSPLSDMSTILPIDAIQEFNLEENPKAEFGWKPGAVVNVGIRSGTNSYHGSAYAFGRNGSWDARGVFNPVPQPVQPVTLEQ